MAWVQIHALPFTSYVTLGKFPASLVSFPHVKIILLHQALLRIQWNDMWATALGTLDFYSISCYRQLWVCHAHIQSQWAYGVLHMNKGLVFLSALVQLWLPHGRNPWWHGSIMWLDWGPLFLPPSPQSWVRQEFPYFLPGKKSGLSSFPTPALRRHSATQPHLLSADAVDREITRGRLQEPRVWRGQRCEQFSAVRPL